MHWVLPATVVGVVPTGQPKVGGGGGGAGGGGGGGGGAGGMPGLVPVWPGLANSAVVSLQACTMSALTIAINRPVVFVEVFMYPSPRKIDTRRALM